VWSDFDGGRHEEPVWCAHIYQDLQQDGIKTASHKRERERIEFKVVHEASRSFRDHKFCFDVNTYEAVCWYLSLQGEDEEENDGEQEDEGDGFFVPHGYLSEGEGCDDDDDDGKVTDLVGFEWFLATFVFTLWRPLLHYGYICKASCARPG